MSDTTVAPATETPAAPAAPQTVTMTQEALDQLITARLERHTASAEKTLEERVAAVEAQYAQQLKDAKDATVRATVLAAVANTHNPDVAANLIIGQLPADADQATIAAKAAEVLAANAWMVKTGAAAPAAPAPVAGAGAGDAAPQAPTGEFLTEAEMDAITIDDLVNDPELNKRYEATRNRG